MIVVWETFPLLTSPALDAALVPRILSTSIFHHLVARFLALFLLRDSVQLFFSVVSLHIRRQPASRCLTPLTVAAVVPCVHEELLPSSTTPPLVVLSPLSSLTSPSPSCRSPKIVWSHVKTSLLALSSSRLGLPSSWRDTARERE